MNTPSLLAIILISLFSLNICQDQVQLFKNLSLTAQTKSGGLLISFNYTENDTVQTDTVTVNLDSLVERDINGTAITDPNHSFFDFSQLTFEVDEFQDGSYGNIPAFVVQAMAHLPAYTNSTITLYAILFSGEGMLKTEANELIKVRPGYVKFMYEINNWQFCTNETADCTGINCCLSNGTEPEIGAYLDLSFNIQGSENYTTSTEDSIKYELGNSDLILSQFIKVDEEEWKNLPTNFPLFVREENYNVYTIRFPAFSFKAFYDPIVIMDGLEGHDDHSKAGTIVGISIIVVVLLLVAFLVFRYFKRSGRQEALMP